MALIHINAATATTATPLVEIPTGLDYVAVQIYNGHSAAIFVGDADVTTTGVNRGNSISNGTSVQIWLSGGDTLWAVSAAASAAGAISVVYSG
jgi:hypothetical protein